MTGGAGFIGANFIYYLLEYSEDEIVCLDLLTYAGTLRTLDEAEKSPRFSFVRGDIADRALVFGLFEREKPDAVVNFAAESHVDRSVEEPGIFLRTNVLGTQVLMDACREHGIWRFHQISTDEVYGELPLNRPDLLFSEESRLFPSNPYSASKAAADLLALAYHRTYGLPVTISRCSNNYGRYQFPEKLIPRMIALALKENPLPLYGTGENVRDWLSVTDHCAAVDLILRRGRVGEVYNIGGRNERANLEVVRGILSILGKPESLIQFVPDRPGHDLRYAVDFSKAKQELGWEPSISFEEGLKQTVDWYVRHPDWWQEERR